MRKRIVTGTVIVIIVVLLGLGIWLGQKYYGKTDEDRAVATLKEYLKIGEDRRQFGLDYTFLSLKKKEELEERSIFNVEDYKEFQETGGRVLNSEILKVEKIGENNINIVVKWTVTDEGIVFSEDITFFMIKENNEWKVDDWEDIPSTYKEISVATRWDERTKK